MYINFLNKLLMPINTRQSKLNRHSDIDIPAKAARLWNNTFYKNNSLKTLSFKYTYIKTKSIKRSISLEHGLYCFI